MDLGLAGRTAVVTGASRGIGRGAATALGAEGASVLLVARGAADLEAAVDRLKADGVDASGLVLDVSGGGAAQAVVQRAHEQWGGIDILVNNAGGGPEGSDHVRDFDAAVWSDVYRANVVAPMALAVACVGGMVERGWGRIVNVASTMARDPDPRFGSYGAAKAALLHATRSFSQTYAAAGVMINAVLPGLTRSEGVLAGYEQLGQASGRTAEEVEARMMQRQPIAAGRTGEVHEVADAIAFLCSERASWITGALLLVDGGTVRVLP
jgi:3-oxoacyl-[acyl-carrier protein] reductase